MIPVTEVLRVHPRDNVLVALRDLQPGETVRSRTEELIAKSSVPRGHKLATTPVSAGSPILKYGWPIGLATQDIASGEYVHTHNLATTLRAHEDYTYVPVASATPRGPADIHTFLGYPRRNGRVGTRTHRRAHRRACRSKAGWAGGRGIRADAPIRLLAAG